MAGRCRRDGVRWRTPGRFACRAVFVVQFVQPCCSCSHSACPALSRRRKTPMSLTGLLDAVVQDPALAEAVRAAADGNRRHVDLVGPPAARPFALAALARDAG
ncbi:hypothetical protein, partial [Streptomyces sparsus]